MGRRPPEVPPKEEVIAFVMAQLLVVPRPVTLLALVRGPPGVPLSVTLLAPAAGAHPLGQEHALATVPLEAMNATRRRSLAIRQA